MLSSGRILVAKLAIVETAQHANYGVLSVNDCDSCHAITARMMQRKTASIGQHNRRGGGTLLMGIPCARRKKRKTSATGE
jgi:hypothetical protein